MSSYEQARRAQKVRNIVLVVWTGLDDAGRRNPGLPWAIHQMDEAWWADVAQRAGKHRPPSEETKRQVVEQLADLVNAQRRGAPAECKECHGHGSLATREIGSSDGLGPAYDCQRCRGTGAEPCPHCFERSGTVVHRLGLICPTCVREIAEAEREAEPREHRMSEAVH